MGSTGLATLVSIFFKSVCFLNWASADVNPVESAYDKGRCGVLS